MCRLNYKNTFVVKREDSVPIYLHIHMHILFIFLFIFLIHFFDLITYAFYTLHSFSAFCLSSLYVSRSSFLLICSISWFTYFLHLCNLDSEFFIFLFLHALNLHTLLSYKFYQFETISIILPYLCILSIITQCIYKNIYSSFLL